MEKDYTDEELEIKFKEILGYYKSIYSPTENPKVVLLGGQPGAGKSGLENMVNVKKNYVSISGDDYREYHPRFKEINLEYGREASKYTQQWAAEITEKLIKELRKEKYNLIIEGTLRTAELPLKEANAFKKAGYKVELNVVVVKPEKSRLGTLERYEAMLKQGKVPRMTPKEHHDLVVNNIGNNLEIIYNSKAFDNIKLFDRENNLLYNYKESPNVNPKDILNKEFNRVWKKGEIEEFKEKWENLIKIMESRKAPIEEISQLKIEKNQVLERISKIKEQIKENLWSKKIEKDKSKGFGRD
ncbi:zeta toxin family protein [Fusobacterium animalis]|uniref:Zeta-toxin n=1 Tax=Fusobacterium animalis TaxID=76859 RepID=A0A2B7YNH0_9FUSO|nr:zeta toxin family protein [Fusobacterium animalis]PGH25604.1 zeta-toxin [Fusobacterium animalis]